jgi:hypothetical protein
VLHCSEQHLLQIKQRATPMDPVNPDIDEQLASKVVVMDLRLRRRPAEQAGVGF